MIAEAATDGLTPAVAAGCAAALRRGIAPCAADSGGRVAAPAAPEETGWLMEAAGWLMEAALDLRDLFGPLHLV